MGGWLRQHRTLLTRSGLIVVLIAVFAIGAGWPWSKPRQHSSPDVGANVVLPLVQNIDVEPYPGHRFSAPIDTPELAIATARTICADPTTRAPLRETLKAERIGDHWKVWRDERDGPPIFVLMRADGRGQPLCLRRDG